MDESLDETSADLTVPTLKSAFSVVDLEMSFIIY